MNLGDDMMEVGELLPKECGDGVHGHLKRVAVGIMVSLGESPCTLGELNPKP